MRRATRGGPFAAVVLCFLLPFFTASSCGSGRETTATGVDIVLGAKLTAQQTSQPLLSDGSVELGPIGADPEAQAVSRDARPWTITALLLTLLGTPLAIGLRRHWREASAAAAAATLIALFQIGSAFHAPHQDISPGAGLMLACAILIVNGLWQIVALMRAGDRSRRARVEAEADPRPRIPSTGQSRGPRG
jgi:predicted outer membrane lipoprotein